jgi:histidinol-phosphate/aromatic aminotransferase/cobyric acid decarboxylase-like protein
MKICVKAAKPAFLCALIFADEFAKALSKKNINIRPIHLEGMENRFLKFAASTDENNRIVLNAIRDILEI